MKRIVSFFSKCGNYSLRDFLLVAGIVMFGAVIRISLYSCSDNYYTAIAMGWVEQALFLMRTPQFIFHQGMAPVTIYAIAGAIACVNNVILGARLVGLFPGIFVVIPYYLVVSRVFNKNTALLSALLLTLFPLHIFFSVLSTSETLYVFFLFLSFLCVCHAGDSFVLLSFSALLLNAAYMTRYEGVLFLPVFFVIVWLQNKKYAVIYGLLSIIALVFWMTGNALASNNPLYFLSHQTATSHGEIMDMIARGNYPGTRVLLLKKWLVVILVAYNPVVVCLSCIGVCACILKRRYMIFVWILLLHAGLLLFKVLTYSLDIHQTRYMLSAFMFLLPFAACGYMTLVSACTVKLRTVVHAVSIGGLVFASLMTSYAERPQLPGFVAKVAGWIDEHVNDNEIIILDMDRQYLYDADIVVRSQKDVRNFIKLPLVFFHNGNQDTKRPRGMPPWQAGGMNRKLWKHSVQEPLYSFLCRGIPGDENLFVTELFAAPQVKYFVFANNGLASQLYSVTGRETEVVLGYRLTRVFNTENYSIYHIEKP